MPPRTLVLFLECKSEHRLLYSYFLQVLLQWLSVWSHLAILPFFYSRSTGVLLMLQVRVLPCLEALCMLPQLLFAWLLPSHPSESLNIPWEAFLDSLPTFQLG